MLEQKQASNSDIRTSHTLGDDSVSDVQSVPRRPDGKNWDPSAPELYLNREITWLNFNRRVLAEAQDPRTKLLERVKFVAIVCSNLDEFFMKRIGGLKQQIGAGLTDLSVDGRNPQQQIEACHHIIRDIEEEKNQLFMHLTELLQENGIELLEWPQFSAEEQVYLRDYFYANIFPLVTPQGIDPAHPFPFISNLSLNLLVTLRHPGEEQPALARVKVPVGPDVPRFLRIPGTYRFARLEDVMSQNLDLLFPKMEVLDSAMFRVTRNAVTELDEEQADDLLEMIETELRYRRFAAIVRLQVSPQMNKNNRGMLAAELGLDEESDVFEVKGMMGKSDLMEVAMLDLPQLRDPAHHPVDHPRLQEKSNFFHNLRRNGPILIYHPFESFSSSVERFLLEASNDPKVRAIKMTLYRTSKDSKVIHSLVNAALNGKQVAVVVELKARFDEAANIRWANRLEEAGIHVTYGVVGFKTHSKTILVVRKDYDGIRRYAHIGTGNYHGGTARLYTDLGYFTCDAQIGQDLTEFFNYLSTGFTPKRQYKKLVVAPSDMKRKIISKINREIEFQKSGEPGHIRLKMNALEDSDITRALYKAGMAGVKVELIVRDTCRLRPGIADLSDTITVISIVGRFLEHARVYYFRNGGTPEIFLGSADIMTRNLESRVEVLVPIEDPILQRDLGKLLDIQLADRRSTWDMKPDGTYVQRQPSNPAEEKGCQERVIEIAEKRESALGKFKRVKSKAKSKKVYWSSY
ncbi:Polyphosphate kinase [Sulfidibacter corallicola]|uniref:Polyphosphate kinase n=1 Tax=Sulfidibacter corallicola TaxID=2818388 RepID=A0A8A4TFY9_SULCO|nr:polyphosphate kinase 1 [Sulfidibacter corallicola]QTD47681.1 polyphosphate kinase 1 [Sulfidibacter corallicola]